MFIKFTGMERRLKGFVLAVRSNLQYTGVAPKVNATHTMHIERLHTVPHVHNGSKMEQRDHFWR